MMLAPARNSCVPAAVAVLDLGRRLDRLLAQRLPRLAQVGAGLQRHAADTGGAQLEQVLLAHAASLDALDFTLLVAAGLRAGPLVRNEAAFRRQAAMVADCTEATWGAVKDFVETGAREAVAAESLLSDLVMEARAIQRQAGEARATTTALVAEAQARAAGEAGDDLRGAWTEQGARGDALLQRIAGIEALASSSRRVQSGSYRVRDEQVALAGSLKALALGLGGGLLERLRPLIGPSERSAAEDLARAEEARRQLQQVLQDAQDRLQRLRASQAALLGALQEMERQAAALA